MFILNLNNFRYCSRDFNFDSVSMKQRQCKTLDRDRSSRGRNVHSTDLITIPKCSTEKMKRKQMNASRNQDEGCKTDTLVRKTGANNVQQHSTLRKSSSNLHSETLGTSLSHSLGSVKNVTIHPEVTQFSYNHHKPR